MASGETGSEAPAPVRVLIAEDHDLVLEAILYRLARDERIEVAGVAHDGAGLITLYQSLYERGVPPDVVLTDHQMPGMTAPAVIRRLLDIDPDARVVVLSGFDDAAVVAGAIQAGAAGYLLKTLPPEELAGKVHAAARGEAVFGRESARLVLDAVRGRSARGARPGRELSPREIEVLALVSEGLSNQEIGERLFISAQTVKTHLEHAFRKLAVSDRAAAVRKAMQAGLIS
jgi:DNA-binding NarL/FixJ family response regulator